jgi:hypothetical protein
VQQQGERVVALIVTVDDHDDVRALIERLLTVWSCATPSAGTRTYSTFP